MMRQVQLLPGALDEGASSYRVTGAGEDADPCICAGQVTLPPQYQIKVLV